MALAKRSTPYVAICTPFWEVSVSQGQTILGSGDDSPATCIVLGISEGHVRRFPALSSQGLSHLQSTEVVATEIFTPSKPSVWISAFWLESRHVQE